MNTSFKEFEKTKRSKLVPSYFKKGLINKVNTESWTADVQIVGSSQGILKNIPLGSSIPSGVKPGDKCVLITFDETNPNDIVVSYVYGRKIKPKFSTGSATVTTGGITIPHGLGQSPDAIFFYKTASPHTTTSVNINVSGSNSAGIVNSSGSNPVPINTDVYEYQVVDNTNLYLKSTDASVTVIWIAILF